MSRNHVVAVALAVALGALFAWILLGGDVGDGGDDLERGAGAAAEESGRTSPGGDPNLDARTPAILFGRPRRERVGSGGLRGRIVEFEKARGVSGTSLLLVGVGLGGEDVHRETTSNEDGTFTFVGIPAGDAYHLRIRAAGFPARLVPGVRVRDGTTTDLAVLGVGEATPFEGVVVDARGVGVPGARVQIHAGHVDWGALWGRLPELFAELDRDPEPLMETRTLAGGRFVFDEVDPGPVTITVRAAGYAPGHRTWVITPADPVSSPARIRLQQGRAVSGRVLDSSFEPIAGARVAAIDGNDPVAFVFGRAFAYTGADGAFSVDAVRAGSPLQLMVAHPDYPLTTTIVESDRDRIDIVLEGGVTLVVRVVEGPFERGVQGAAVLLSVAAPRVVGRSPPEAVASGVTDPTGRVEFGLCPGVLEMAMVTHPDQAPGFWMRDPGAAGLVAGWMEGPADGVLTRGRREITLKFRGGVWVAGRVTDEETGAPIADARVSTFSVFQSGRSATTDAGGKYVVRAAAGKSTSLIVRATGYAPTTGAFSVPWDRAVDGRVEHDIQMTRGAVVTGRIVDQRGKPIAGAQVRAQVPVEDAVLPFSPGAMTPTTALSGRTGAFVLDGVPRTEEARLVVHRPGYVDGVSKFFSTEGGGVHALQVVLKDGHDVEVEVVDPSGLPVAGASVRLSYERQDGASFDEWSFMGDGTLGTDPDGLARQGQVPSCTLRCVASHPAWADGGATCLVEAGGGSPLRVRVSLAAARVIQGLIVDDEGKPVERATVRWDSYGYVMLSTTVVEGEFELKVALSEPIDLHVQAPGYRNRAFTVVVGQDQVRVQLVREDPVVLDVRRRIDERELAILAAKDGTERNALRRELERLYRELAELGGEPGADGSEEVTAVESVDAGASR